MDLDKPAVVVSLALGQKVNLPSPLLSPRLRDCVLGCIPETFLECSRSLSSIASVCRIEPLFLLHALYLYICVFGVLVCAIFQPWIRGPHLEISTLSISTTARGNHYDGPFAWYSVRWLSSPLPDRVMDLIRFVGRPTGARLNTSVQPS
jgi:hypothetical protein